MSRLHDSSVWVCDADRVCGGTFVDNVCRDGTKVGSTATICDGKRVGRNDDWGGTYGKRG